MTVEDVGSGEDILNWVHSGLIDAVFTDVKYNGEKMALWERNYLGRYCELPSKWHTIFWVFH